ncbi:MAG: translation initiation factor IF-2 [Planctomycetes bacterium]|nr:translation initiation factor IF-2 [Planctomycetota bacterium]
MSTKKRIHELAKEYGMTGPDLVNKLKALGVSDVKSSSSTLDDFQLLVVEGKLLANGILKAPAAPKADAPAANAGESVGGVIKNGVIKKKKKVTLADIGGETAAEPVAPTADSVSIPVIDPAPDGPGPGPALKPVAAVPAPVEVAPAVIEPAPSATEVPTKVLPLASAPATAVEAPAASAPNAETLSASNVAQPGENPDLVRPAARRPGKVVGFVDLAKVTTTTAPKKPDSRRLRSMDDVTPDVQPTLGHDKKKALVRGDAGSRGQMTASQLKEQASGRFLRSKRGPTPAGGPAPRSQRGRPTDASASPLAGSEVKLEAPVTVKKLAESMSIKTTQLLAKAIEQNLGLLNINSVLDDDTAALIALEFGVTLTVAHEVQAETELVNAFVKQRTEVEESALITRAPSIAILGHVDHGKTTLIDRIRSSKIAEGESGGITQHIGAYQVATKLGHTLTILDTPGHEAFTAMRARGADAVDIVVLVVAADDGVMPATVEALSHARAAKKKVVVALNKCDKPGANPKRVREELSKEGLIPEEWGGDTAMLEVSALTGQNVDELLERVFLESEVLELKAHAKGPASGLVLEAEVEKGLGRVAHLLVKDGTLNTGDVILAGEGFGRVRMILDDRGQKIESAGPSMPVQVTGLDELPSVGDSFYVVSKLDQAREVAEERRKKNRQMSMAERKQATTENILQALADQAKKTINVILRADVQGSMQALEAQIRGLTHPEIDVKLLAAGLGTVTENDINLAATSGGIVLAFRVSTDSKARDAAERLNVEIRPYEVIYELLDDLRTMMEGTLAPEMTEQVTGHIEIRALFKSSKFGTIAGSHVIDGAVQRDNRVRVLRKGKLVHEGAIAGLRREKDDVREVRDGFDCGVTIKDFDLFELGDVIEGFKVVPVKRKLGKS